MKKIIFFASVFYTLSITAQNNFILPDSLSQIFMNSKGGSASGSIPQKFMNKFIFPGFITNELKDAASDKLKNFDYFGASVSGNFAAVDSISSPKLIDISSDSGNSSTHSDRFKFGLDINLSSSRDYKYLRSST